MSVLAGLGVGLDGRCTETLRSAAPAFDDGTLRHPTGETVEFEGEALALTVPTPGFYILVGCGAELPLALTAYISAEERRDGG